MLKLARIRFTTLCVFFFSIGCVFSQNTINDSKKNPDNIKIGAYYFDGWTGTYPYHITQELTNSFSEREPIWGWITSSQDIVNKQIKEASQAGLSFFSFCWYYTEAEKQKKEPLNNALNFYLKSDDIDKLQYMLLVVNYGGASIGPDDWNFVCAEWIKQFKNKSYVKVNGKPLITFFSINSLLEKFKTANKVKEVLDYLRSTASKSGLEGVSIAICIGSSKDEIQLAESCGFDILTGYNYHSSGFSDNKKVLPVENLQKGELNIWNRFANMSKLPYIPVATLNWDPRPWASTNKSYSDSPYFAGFSENSVYNSVLACKKWLETNSNNTVKEKIGFIYAWNEYGEGAYLTPTKSSFNPLIGLKKALKN
ncbi:glycoside hydrolase family 99-like domain-containing protein [Flavobacterium mesophilum]|uniref:glycoside hydrolase family 99-like domain-containing protein n=1 Tax=Flavobacterium mesophilum TaxID=3143495 RepID=UPI0031DB50F5